MKERRVQNRYKTKSIVRSDSPTTRSVALAQGKTMGPMGLMGPMGPMGEGCLPLLRDAGRCPKWVWV